MSHETSTDYRHPYRPRLLRAVNEAARLLPSAVTLAAPLGEESLLAAARRRTGLQDFGDPSFREPLRRLVAAIEDEARLHPLGRLITRVRLVSTLATRLRLEQMLRTEPSIREERLTRPIVIVGLPRTGTTFLHRLLASDSTRIRALMSWEALMPVPLEGEEEPKKRIVAAQRSERALRYMAPDFFAVHPIDAVGPEEDILLLDLAFRSTVPEATMHVPSFAAWLEQADQGPAYRQMATALKALQRQRRPPGEAWRWVLKTPHHLEWLDELPKVLEDPLVVWTHRAPREVVASFCSMIAHGRGVFSDEVDPHEIGRSWLRKGKRMVERAMDARARWDRDDFVDVRYQDLIADPVAVVRRIQERAGLPWTQEGANALGRSLQRETKDRHGKHRYSLEAFGLDPAVVDEAFAIYDKNMLG